MLTRWDMMKHHLREGVEFLRACARTRPEAAAAVT
jgi:hypothetical protein